MESGNHLCEEEGSKRRLVKPHGSVPTQRKGGSEHWVGGNILLWTGNVRGFGGEL